MCTDNCGWTVVAAKPQSPLNPVYDTSFLSHMKGTIGRGAHTGCHSLYGRDTATRRFEQENGADKRVLNANCSMIYSAKVSLSQGVDVRGRHEWGEEKLSSFWPDTMCFECVQSAITYAWKNQKAVATGGAKHHSQAVQAARVVGVAAWAGEVNIKRGTESFRIWVGSPQQGTTAKKIYSAYPKIGATLF